MSTTKTSKSHDKKKINLVEKFRGSLFNESHLPAVKEEILLTIIKKSILLMKTTSVRQGRQSTLRPPWPFQPLGSPALPSFNWSLVNGEVPWANVILGINIGGIGAKTRFDQKFVPTVGINR